jgi:hypothetical protein
MIKIIGQKGYINLIIGQEGYINFINRSPTVVGHGCSVGCSAVFFLGYFYDTSDLPRAVGVCAPAVG